MRNICLVLIVGFTSIVYAKNSYHVNELVSMVIKNHPSIKVQEHMIRGANAQVEGAKWNYFPTVSFSANQGVNKNKLWDGTAVVSQPLWTGGKLDAAYDMAIANKYNSESGLGESGYTLVETLLNALNTYLKSKGNLKALSEGQKQLNILKNMLSRRIDAGVSSRSDMELLKARLYQMQTDINFAKASMQASLSQIELMTNHNFKGDLKVDERIDFDFASLDKMTKSMIKTHPTLKKYDALIDYAEAEKSNAEAVYMPNVSLRLERGAGSDEYYYNDSMKETRVSVSVDASFGAGLSALSGIEQAEAKIMQLKQEKLSTQQDLMNQIMFAYNDYISSSRRVTSQSGSIASSQKVFESYTRLFLAGKRQWLDLVNTSRELTQNEMAFADTKSTLMTSAYKLLLLSGKSDLLNIIPERETKRTTKNQKPNKQNHTIMSERKERSRISDKTTHTADTADRAENVDLKTLTRAMKSAAKDEKKKAEQERLAKLKAEKEKAEKIKLAKEKAEKIKLARAKAEKAKAEKQKLAREKAERARLAKAKAEKEKFAKLRTEKQRLAREKAEQERLAKQKAEKEKAEKIKLAKAKAKAEKAKAEKQRLAKIEQEKRKKAEQQRVVKAENTNTDKVSAHSKYYVQFDIQPDEEMKNKFKKQNLKMLVTKDGQYLVGSYGRAVEALTVAREIRKIIHEEAYIVKR